MKPGDIIVCTDARFSECRLKEWWRYVVSAVTFDTNKKDASYVVSDGPCLVQLLGVSSWSKYHGDIWFKSSRFRPLERKEIEDKVNSMIADKILDELAKEE